MAFVGAWHFLLPAEVLDSNLKILYISYFTLFRTVLPVLDVSSPFQPSASALLYPRNHGFEDSPHRHHDGNGAGRCRALCGEDPHAGSIRLHLLGHVHAPNRNRLGHPFGQRDVDVGGASRSGFSRHLVPRELDSALGYTVLKCAVRSEVGPGKKAAGGSRTCEVAVFSACRAPGVVLYPTRTCSARGASGRSCSGWNDKTTRTETMDEASSAVTFRGQCSTALSRTGQRTLEVERFDNGEYKCTYRLSGATPWRLSLELVASCA
jgi:hypothetical protein